MFLIFFLHLYLGGEQHLKKTEATDRIVMNGNKYKKVSQCIYYLKVVLLIEYWYEFPLCVFNYGYKNSCSKVTL